MATFWATYNTVENRGRVGYESQPVMKGRDAEGLTALTTSGTSQIVQRAAADWAAPDTGYVTLRCDGAVWVHFALVPVAAASTDWYIPANETRDFSVMAGDKIAVIDA